MPVLVKTSFDYGDEFDCKEFNVFSDEDYEQWIADWERKLTECNEVLVWFGTNEHINIDSFEQFEQSIEVIEILEADKKVFDKYFDGAWGTGDIFSFDEFDEGRDEGLNFNDLSLDGSDEDDDGY
jgi:hypothetical protein